jgi:predicted DNA-binding protein (UPF0251 family)
MARPRNVSKVQIPPRIKGFIPVGYYADESKPVQLNIEEYESIRLLDYEGLSQVEAAEMMEVSRPTLTRIYERARRNIAIALTETHQLMIEGGTAIYNGEWYECTSCSSKFNNPDKVHIVTCPLCSAKNVHMLSYLNESSYPLTIR